MVWIYLTWIFFGLWVITGTLAAVWGYNTNDPPHGKTFTIGNALVVIFGGPLVWIFFLLASILYIFMVIGAWIEGHNG